MSRAGTHSDGPAEAQNSSRGRHPLPADLASHQRRSPPRLSHFESVMAGVSPGQGRRSGSSRMHSDQPRLGARPGELRGIAQKSEEAVANQVARSLEIGE